MRTLLALAFAGAFSFQAMAQEIHQRPALLCDTEEQVLSVVSEYVRLKDTEAALNAVNKAAGNPVACTIQNVAFVVLSQGQKITNELGEGIVITILVVSFQPPMPQFSILITKQNSGA